MNLNQVRFRFLQRITRNNTCHSAYLFDLHHRCGLCVALSRAYLHNRFNNRRFDKQRHSVIRQYDSGLRILYYL